MRRLFRVSIVSLALLSIVACSKGYEVANSRRAWIIVARGPYGTIYRVDPGDGTRCYVLHTGQGGGLSCMR